MKLDNEVNRHCSTWNTIVVVPRGTFSPANWRRVLWSGWRPKINASSRMISFRRYAELLAQPEVRHATIASLLGRLPVGMAGLAILLLTQSTTGSFASAGTITSAYIAGLALFAPLFGRAIDRSGPRLPLLACAALYPTSLVALVLSVRADASFWQIMSLAASAGATFPPITVSMRSFLKQQVHATDLLATAYSLESVLIEGIFILGPLLVSLITFLASPASVVLTAAACGFLGALLFASSPALEHWNLGTKNHLPLLGPLNARGFPALLSVVFFYSVAFGLIEIGVTAFATRAGQRVLAGVLLGLMSVGSVFGGIVYGSRSWHAPLHRQFAIALFLMGGGLCVLALASSVCIFGAASVLAGLVMAPALAIQSLLVSQTSPPEHVTEAFTWSSTALLTGVGIGTSGGGWLLERCSAASVLALAGAISILASAAALTGLAKRKSVSV